MKSLILLGALIFTQFAFATEAPANYPVVKGIVRKVDVAAGRISIKHEDIPNLEMPGMTMSFAVQNPDQLKGLAVGDQIVFVADEIDGEVTVLWLEKAETVDAKASEIFCTGVAETTPKTKIELEIRSDKFSTIRYEFAEGSLKGTAHVNSMGRLQLQKSGDFSIYSSGSGENATKLVFRESGGQILDASFTHYSSGMKNSPVQCAFE